MCVRIGSLPDELLPFPTEFRVKRSHSVFRMFCICGFDVPFNIGDAAEIFNFYFSFVGQGLCCW